MGNQDYYELLGVARTASTPEIVQSFRTRAMALHPDRNKDNPEAATQFKQVSQAYHTLTDPVLRAKYDSSLPEDKVSSPTLMDFTLQELWKITGKIYLERTARYTKAVDALQNSAPIIIDEESDLLIVGIEPVNTILIGYLESSETHNTVKDILTEVYGKPLDFRIITGTSLSDYQQLKDAEDRLWKRKKASAIDINNFGNTPPVHQEKTHVIPKVTSPVMPVSPIGTWDDLLVLINTSWAIAELPELPQVRAAFALNQLPPLARQEKHSTKSGDPVAATQQKVGQVLEHIAGLAGIDATVLGMEYVRHLLR